MRILELNIKSLVTPVGQNTMENVCEEELLPLTTQVSTEEIDPQTIIHQSEADTRDLTCKTSSIEEKTIHQNERGKTMKGLRVTRGHPRRSSLKRPRGHSMTMEVPSGIHLESLPSRRKCHIMR